MLASSFLRAARVPVAGIATGATCYSRFSTDAQCAEEPKMPMRMLGNTGLQVTTSVRNRKRGRIFAFAVSVEDN